MLSGFAPDTTKGNWMILARDHPGVRAPLTVHAVPPVEVWRPCENVAKDYELAPDEEARCRCDRVYLESLAVKKMISLAFSRSSCRCLEIWGNSEG